MFPAIPKKKKPSTRRSISVKGLTYQRLEEHCKAEGHSVSGWLEAVIAEKMDAAGVPVPLVLRVHTPKRRTTKDVESERAACFSL